MAANEAALAAPTFEAPNVDDPSPGEAGRLRRLHWSSWLCLALVVVGVFLRARQFAARRSLWLDEAMITDNIVRRNLHQLTEPLSHHQGAPFGWLLAEKVSIHLFGTNEYTLRLTAFVTGSLTLLLVWWVAARILPRELTPLAVLAAAVAPQLIRYSNEVKQYSSDSFAVMLVVALAIWLVTSPKIAWWQALLWAVGGSFAVLFSHPGILATASCGAVVLASLLLRRSWRELSWVAGTSCLIVIALFAHYELALKNLSKDAALKAYWRGGNPPTPLHFVSTMKWLGAALLNYSHDPLKLAPPVLVGILVIAGLVALFRRGWAIAAVLIAPLLAQLIASTAGAFPMSGRLVLGYVPILLLVIASAPTLLQGRRWFEVGVAGVVLAMLTPNVALAAQRTVHPLQIEELRPVLQRVAADQQPGDLIFVHYAATAAMGVYALLGLNVPSNGSMFTGRGTVCADGQLLQSQHALGQRVWFISGHEQSYFRQEGQLVRDHLARLGRTLEDVRRTDAEALLVQLPPSVPLHQPSIDGTCLRVVRVR